MVKHWVLRLLFGLYLGAASASAAPVLVLDAQTPSIQPVTTKAEQLLDIERQYTIDTLPEQGFEPVTDRVSHGYQSGRLWLRLALQNATEQPKRYLLDIRPTHLDQVTLHQQFVEGEWLSQHQGRQASWQGREVAYRNSLFLIELQPGETRPLLVEIETTTNLAAQLRLLQPPAFIMESQIEMLVFGGFFISLLVICLMNFVQFAIIKERAYLVYGLYLLILGVYFFLVEGLLHYLVQPQGVLDVTAWISLLHALIFLMSWLVFRQVVNFKRHALKADRWLTLGVLAVTGFALLAVPLGLDVWLRPWLWLLVSVLFLLMFILSVWLSFKGLRTARLYILAFGPMLLVSVYTILALMGWVTHISWNNYQSLLVIMLHMLLMQLSVSEHTYAAKQNFEKARESALHQALEEEKTGRLEQAHFMHLVTHEFRTPLMAAMSANELIGIKRPQGEDLDRLLVRQKESLSQLSGMIEKVLQADETGKGVWRRNTGRVALQALIQQVIARMDGQSQARIQCFTGDDEVYADADLLSIAFYHLLDNALHYSLPGSTIELGLINSDYHVTLTLQDQGPGIAPEDWPRLLGKYQRGNQVMRPGLGLGLYTVDRILRLHGGEIELDSQYHQGCRLQVHLPK